MMLKYFKYITPVADENIVNNQIVTEKDNWGAQVFQEYSKYFSVITAPLETKFGSYKHVQKIVATANIRATENYQNIQ